jgi:hypothetical protein
MTDSAFPGLVCPSFSGVPHPQRLAHLIAGLVFLAYTYGYRFTGATRFKEVPVMQEESHADSG